MRLIVTGGRRYADREHVYAVLDALLTKYETIHLFHGAATGADLLADAWARSRSVRVTPCPADWKKYGHDAGKVRNSTMLMESQAELVAAFPGGTGTADMVRKAEFQGVPVLTFERRL